MTKIEEIDFSVPPTNIQADRITDWLVSSGYRVIRPLAKRTAYSQDKPPADLIKVAILDTETTGLDLESDRIIELGLLVVEVCPKTGVAYRVLQTFNELEDPGFPVPDESVRVHGITDTMVKGKKIDGEKVEALISDVDLVIAHNAGFDRPFVERRLPSLASKPWACSLQQIPWKEEGVGGASQEFIAYHFGFHYVGHRASNDCEALLEILQQRLPASGRLAMQMLLEKSKMTEVRISVLDSPFEKKEFLKARGYRWNPERKLWFRSIQAETLSEEISWLKTAIHGGKTFRLEQETLNSMNRFSARRGEVEIVSYK